MKWIKAKDRLPDFVNADVVAKDCYGTCWVCHIPINPTGPSIRANKQFYEWLDEEDAGDKWVDVSTPPEEREKTGDSDTVLIFGNGYISIGNYDHELKKWYSRDIRLLKPITHYMPLPSPPKEK